MIEHRFILTDAEALEIAGTCFGSVWLINDLYTGQKRIRTDNDGTTEKIYPTPASGKIYHFITKCLVDDFPGWFELKWTDKVKRFEIEFEQGTPPRFVNRPNIPGWDILK